MEDLTLDDLYMELNTSYFPPTKRYRIIKQLEAAGKLKRKNSSALELIQEKFELEAHILNKTVIVDDGSERKVYSTCAFEGVKRYNCNVCIVAIFGKTSLIQHNCGKKHYYMMQSTTHPHQNFDDHQIINLDPGMKTISLSDCHIVGDLLDKCPKQNIIHILIGLEYLVEVHDPRQPYYHCLLCNKMSYDIANTMDHLQSVEHRLFYLLLFFPKVYTKLLLLKREIRMVQLAIVVENIEKKFGRLKPWRHEGALSLKQKRAIRHSIDSGPHIRDNAELSFAEDIVFNDKVKNTRCNETVFTEFVVNETEDSVIDIYERQKGGIFRCRLCRMKVDSLIEKITHPYTGRHLEKTVKGIAIYDSVLCQIQSVFESFPQPLIGTEYIVEYDEQGIYLYHCMLCRKAMNNHDMVTSHLVSKAHRQRYIKHHMPKKDEELLKLSGPVRAEEIEKLLKLVEAKHGRLPPFGCLFSLEHQIDSRRTVKDLIGEKIMDGKHFTIDERGIPRIINKMPVPLFPKEGQIVPEAGAQSKKKKKKKKHRSSSRSPKRKRSNSSTSSRSLSPVARQRGLSPEPGPSTRFLPHELIPPPVVVQDWLNSSQETELQNHSMTLNHSMLLIGSCQLTKKAIKEFFSKCDEENWIKRTHDCCPYLSSSCPLKEALKNDEVFYDLRRFFIVLWLKEKMVRENGWKLEQLDVGDAKFRNMAKIMETGRLCTEVCRPLCRNLVEAMIHCVIAEFPETQEMTEEEIIISCRGLVNLSNWLHLIWLSIPKMT